jgi:hypothetical protein
MRSHLMFNSANFTLWPVACVIQLCNTMASLLCSATYVTVLVVCDTIQHTYKNSAMLFEVWKGKEKFRRIPESRQTILLP